MFESVGKRESDQLGTNVRERGRARRGHGTSEVFLYTSPPDLYARTPPFRVHEAFPKRRFYLSLHVQDPDRFQLAVQSQVT